MTPELLVRGLKARLVDSTVDEYREHLENNSPEHNTGVVSPRMFSYYQSLDSDQREIFFDVVRQIEIDTVADFLAYLDGAYWFQEQTADMRLTTVENPEEPLNGSLADIFLNLVHDGNH